VIMNKVFRKTEVTYPTFLYIGAEKAGSSWIYEILREHPEVFVPVAKDIQFFGKSYKEKSFDWYLSFFKLGAGKKAIGELSHDYFLSEETATVIQKHLPEVRLLCCLREPVERTVSSFCYYRTTFLDKKISFEAFAFDERVLKLSDYYYNLRPFYERFPRENILVLFFDDLKNDPWHFAERIYEFLRVDPGFQPEVLHQKVLPASEPRITWLTHLAYKTGLILRKLGLANVVGTVKRNEAFQRLLYRKLEKEPETLEEVRQKLKEYYRERYERLPELIGQPLPEEWL